MEETESILEVIYGDDDEEEDGADVKMDDFEEGEFTKQFMKTMDLMADMEEGELVDDNSQTISANAVLGNHQASETNKSKRKRKKKKMRSSRRPPDVTNINSFVLQTCKRLKERKSHMVYAAAACLGVAALSDILKEVDAVQACGGQMTIDGRRSRSPGGILCNIIKSRAPNAYKEIMKKTKEFEKQFRQQNIKASDHKKEESSQKAASVSSCGPTTSVLEGTLLISQNENKQAGTEGNRRSVHERIRAPVSYDDLL